jgi:glutathione S-transferase
MPFVIKTLSEGPYILGDKFSAIDVLLGTTFALFARGPMASPSPVIDAYAQRVVERPAYARAMAKDAE